MLDARGSGVPALLHWGADLGALADGELDSIADALLPAVANSAVAVPLRTSVLPMLDQAWQGHPALVGEFAGSGSLPPLGLVDATSDGASARLLLAAGELSVNLDYELTVEGLLRVRATVTNTGDAAFNLGELNLMAPLPAEAAEILDFSGRWAAERRPQRREVQDGSWMREQRHGRPGHDSPFVVAVGTPGFAFRRGSVWAFHLGWSGNQRLFVEHDAAHGTVAGAGELLAPGEIVLARGNHYETPWLYGSWSDAGLDAVSERFHRYLRRTRGFDERPHPVILNTWEAVYFDHDDDTLRALATLAAEVGVERFVLDDGWMSGRTDDTRGLGDWTVDAERRPDGLAPLISHVRGLGMDFGLWVEPEMATANSELARAHPEWLLRDTPGSLPLAARNQFVIDLRNPAAFDHIVAQLDALLAEYPIAYLKWDHNRDLLTTRTHDQTLAVYRLLEELAARHPEVEIEACASGGGRIDFRMLESVTRIWPSDTNDSLERQSVYRWTTLLLPPELFGAHLGAPTAHVTGRTHALSYRLATALFGWAGIEWDLRAASPDDLSAIADWIGTYKRLRGLLHSGTVVRADRQDSLWVHGIVSPDLREAVFSISALAMTADAVPAAVRFPGLDPDRSYTVEPLTFGQPPHYLAASLPPWLDDGGTAVPGRILDALGIAAPPLAPEQTLVVRLVSKA